MERLRSSRHHGVLLLLLSLFFSNAATGRVLFQKEDSSPRDGFLDKEIPLTVVSTIPEKLLLGGKIVVTGREPLTVVLSRPVVGLGQSLEDDVPDELKPFFLVPEIPGHYRWLTAYIATFEPAEDWAPDLEVEFEWNTDLVTQDGVPFSVQVNAAVQISTGALSLEAVAITSAQTDELTDGFWDAFVGTSFDALPEVPPDGSLQLAASSPVNLKVLENELRIVDTLTNGNPDVQVSVKECTLPEIPCVDCTGSVEDTQEPDDPETTLSAGEIYGIFTEEDEPEPEVVDEPPKEDATPVLEGTTSTCLNVSFTSNDRQGFLQGRRYSLVLPAETQYSNEAGRLTDDIRINFAGLRDFRVPFVEDKKFNISSSRLLMWLPHGLEEGVNVTDFPIKIVRSNTGQDVDFTLEMVSKAEVRVVGSFTPGSNYRISVFESPRFKDGYGLSLKRSNLNFLAAPIDHYFGTMKVASAVQFAVFEEGQKWGQKILVMSKGSALSDRGVCKKEGSVVSVWDVQEPDAALSLLTDNALEESVTDLLGVAADRLVDERQDTAGEFSEFDISDLLETSGLVAASYCRDDVYQPLVVCETQLQVVVLITSAVTPKGRTAIVWVTDMKSSSPVSDASIVLYELHEKSGDYTSVDSGKTDKDGVGELTFDRDIFELHAVVTLKEKSIYVPNVELRNGVVSAISDSVILDKPIVRPGETLRIKGYVMQNEGGSFVPADIKKPTVIITPSMVSRTKESDEIEVNKYDDRFGSYTVSMRIPLGVIAVHHTVRVKADTPGGETYLGKPEPFTIVDSRRSPAVLSINAPDWALPNKKFKVEATVSSFAGAPIQGARITFRWSIDDNARDEDDELLTGRVMSSTDGNGKTTATIDLSKFANPPSAGTVVEILAEYIGSSGERVARSITVRLEPANAEVIIEKTVHTEIPSQEFGVRVAAFDLSGKRLSSKGTIDVALKRVSAFRNNGRPTLKPVVANKEVSGKAEAKCSRSFKSDEFCIFQLTKSGLYVLEACTRIGKDKVCKREYLGKTEDEWAEKPMEEHLPFGIIPTSNGPYSVGQTATFMVDNPYGEVTALLAWGSRDAVKTTTVTVKPGRTSLKFEVDGTCSNNCALSITVSIPRQTKGLVTELSNPVSRLFDPAMPHTEYITTVIETKRKSATLDMKVSLPGIEIDNGMPLIEPGVNASVRVTFDRKGPVEITAFAIDNAILDLLPYPLKDVSEDFIQDLSDYFVYKSSSDYLVAPGAIDAVSGANEARKKLDPWFKMISVLHPSEDTANIGLTDEEYLEQYVQYLTVVPRTPEQEAADVMELTSRNNGADAEPPVNISVAALATQTAVNVPSGNRLSYVTPSLFESFTASGGVWLVNFEGPAQGGLFHIRAYASTGDGLFGSDEVQVKVRKSISMTYDFPLFARLGDEFAAGATISILNKAEKPIKVTLDISGNLKLDGPDVINLVMGNAREKDVGFYFKVDGIGEARIKITADDGFGNEAVEEIGITIYGPQPPVVVGSAFPAVAINGKEATNDLPVPEALEGSGSIVVTAGKGHLPGILLLADQIYTADSFTCPISADFVLAALAIPAVVDDYFPWSPDPNLLPKFYVDLVNGIVPNYLKAISVVYDQATSQTLGLEPEVPCLSLGTIRPTGVSLEQNAKGIFIISEVIKRLKEHTQEDVYKNTAAASTSEKLWRDILAEGLIIKTGAARAEKERIDPSTVAIARLALGADWEAPKGTSKEIIEDLSMGRLRREFDSMSVESQGYYVLALLGSKSNNQAEVKRAINAWRAKIVTSADVSYLAMSKNAITADSALANAVAFLAMVRGKADKNTLHGMAYYVTSPVSDVYGFTEFSIFGKTVAMMALQEYDATLKTRKTNVRLEVNSGTITLLSASFTPGRHPVSAQSTPWKQLGKEPSPIEVFPQGDGEVSVAIAMKYVPRDPVDNPVYKGIFVDRIIQLDSAGSTSEMVSQVSLGTVVTIRVQFMTPKDLGHTTVQVFLPAGLEPVQLGGDGADYCPVPFFDLFSDEYYESCPEQITLADQVQFVYESVSAGSHAVAFKAVAAISGSFGVAPTRVFVTETPSTMGMSSAGRLDICASDKKCTIERVEREFVVAECPNSCSDNGVCDLSTGDCTCFSGFGGDACQRFGAA